ncbi:MAG: cysteine synthase A [Spirochaetales bacterium]|nr:cysteine synthase A [Spirochaetales bacterium]
MNVAKNITELIGKTPIVDLSQLSEGGARILGKLESFNPCSSVKDRIALAMISKAESEGKISSSTVVVEPTSGNTGIGLAFVCAQRGYRLILTMPESMSIERRKLLTRLGAELVLTAPEAGMRGAVEKAEKICGESADAFMPQQFQNSANPQIHYETTGPEIWDDTDGEVDVLVAAVGTGGTISGVGKYLREKKPDLRIIAVEPVDSPVISGGAPGPHRIQGIGAGFIPDNLDRDIIDEVLTVENEAAFETSRILAVEYGVLAGISSGANVWAAASVSKRQDLSEKTIVTIICDTGERYLSVWAD